MCKLVVLYVWLCTCHSFSSSHIACMDAGVAVVSRRREQNDDAGKKKSRRRSWTVSEVILLPFSLLFYPILFHSTLFFPFHPILPHSTLFYSCSVPFYPILLSHFHSTPFYSILPHSVWGDWSGKGLPCTCIFMCSWFFFYWGLSFDYFEQLGRVFNDGCARNDS